MKKTAALVLSSGGARGVAHIGVIEALLDAGYEIRSISGSSMGAVVGGVYATGKLPEFKEWVCNLDKIDVFKLMDFTLSTQGFVRGERVFNQMKSFIDDCNIEDLDIGFSAVATDIVNKQEVVFDSGSLFTALRASAAIPSVLKPSIINGVELVDGGVLNPIPIAHVKRSEDDIVVVSDVNAAVPCIKPDNPQSAEDKGRFAPLLEKWNSIFLKNSNNKVKRLSYFDLVAKSVDLMQDRISEYIIEHSRPDIVVRISRETCSTFEFYKSKELIDCGRQEFDKSLKHALLGT
ncbi:patatin-like phospholipase family protein [Fulvivirga sp. 29W222]|uniref:Patatin-like phospholipase family protein n=1 Tax=Fulvivirga marina TaxID=2494733 RepID=A0A937KBX7_9BACT|nr:patatin-like phospholipase family protein [Fulvivirga marina]MBL6447526.1 patatin-like phospholipase family protein [Fulvivirga marina]